jgi:4-amino-4-deoxy-L-arabinose transferase-like glycosyltransferase
VIVELSHLQSPDLLVVPIVSIGISVFSLVVSLITQSIARRKRKGDRQHSWWNPVLIEKVYVIIIMSNFTTHQYYIRNK